MNFIVEKINGKIILTLPGGGVAIRIDREEFIPDVLNYLNGGSMNGRRYILETKVIDLITASDAEG